MCIDLNQDGPRMFIEATLPVPQIAKDVNVFTYEKLIIYYPPYKVRTGDTIWFSRRSAAASAAAASTDTSSFSR